MKNLKKILMLGMALTAALALAVACKVEPDSSSAPTDSSSSPNDSSTVPEEVVVDKAPLFPDTYPADGGSCVFGDWELVENAACAEQGVKVRHCILHDAVHDDYEIFAERGHAYNYLAICETCGKKAPLPTIDQSATYLNPADKNSGIAGSGHEYQQYVPYINEYGEEAVRYLPNTGKYELAVDGYYEIELSNTRECWFDFAVPEAGQYAVLSTSNPGDIVLEQYASSAQTNFLMGEGSVLKDGNVFSVASCTKLYFNPAWRATFRLSGNAGDTIKFHIAKIAPTHWEPGYINVNVEVSAPLAKAPEGEQGSTPVVVPYDSEYFYDETSGYYRMGSKDAPGDVIFAAITKNAERLMGEQSFISLQTESAGGLRCAVGMTVEGDHLIHNYAPLIYKNPEYNGRENSYEAFVNSDGLYPVTQELYDFLSIYTASNYLAVPPEEGEGEHVWLSACYYYTVLTPGSEGNPFLIDTLGDHTVTMESIYEQVYCKITYTETATCTITMNTDGIFWIDGERHSSSEGAVTFETKAEGVVISFLTSASEIIPIEFTIA